MSTADQLLSAGRSIARHTGLSASGAGNARLESRLRERSAALGMTIDAYVARLDHDADETQNLVDHLTIQETSFFRDEFHFEALVRRVLPANHGPITVWSAGCATGAEPYSLAMALDEAGVADFRVVATDISRPAVERVRAGWYRESELRGLSAARRGRYLARAGDGWEIDPDLRARITVEHHNLLVDPVPAAPGELLAVFCRNVFIYLERARITTFLETLRPHLTDEGVVFVGGSESIWAIPEGYRLDRLGDAFCYRRARRCVSPPAPVAPPQRPRFERRSTPAPAAALPEVSNEPAPATVLDDPRTEVERHRRAVYRSPDDVLAHLRLALALEADDDLHAAQRAFRAALGALARADERQVEVGLEGYDVATLRTMLELKIEQEESCPR